MLSTFLDHQWKSFWRSRNRGGSIASQVILGLFMLYFLAVAIGAGLAMHPILSKMFPQQDVIKSFNGLILYYFAFDFIMRIQLQELPTLSVVPYLHLPIARHTIIRFLNVKALFSVFNLIPLFVFLPFCFMQIMPVHGFVVMSMYIVAILSLTLFNNYLILFLKRKSITNMAYTLTGLVLIGTLAALEYEKVISIAAISDRVFRAVIAYPFAGLGFIIPAFVIFLINTSYLRRNLYVEELSKRQKKKASTDYAFLNRFGRIGELTALEIKLILRHKRPRNSVIMGVFLLCYGFLFYKEKAIATDAFATMLFAAIFMIGFTTMIYGQFVYAWQSAHFDGLLANKVDLKEYLKAKLLLFNLMATIGALLASFYAFLSVKLLLLHLAAYLYVIGFSTILVLYIGTFSYKRIDINASANFNYQGVGAGQWLLMLPFIAVPYLIYWPFGAMNQPYLGLAAIGLLGLIMLLTRNFWIDLILKRFEQQRYKIAEGFRE